MWLPPTFWLGAFPSVPAHSEGSFLSLVAPVEPATAATASFQGAHYNHTAFSRLATLRCAGFKIKIKNHVPYCRRPNLVGIILHTATKDSQVSLSLCITDF